MRPATARGVVLALAVALVAGLVASLFLGSAAVPAGEVAHALLHPDAAPSSTRQVVWSLRLPRGLTAALAGAALAVSGLLMQTLFRNPLAGPYVLGIQAGATLGVALVVLAAGAGGASFLGGLGAVGSVGVTLASTAGAAVVLLLVLAAAARVSGVTLLILGLLVAHAASGLVTVLLHFAAPEQVQAFVSWTFGSFAGVAPGQLPVLAVSVVVGLAVAGALVKPLDALLLGERYAESVGVLRKAVRASIIGATGLLAGSVTGFCGPVAFLGVAVPHLARGLVGTNAHRVLLPVTLLVGASVALVADLLARVPGQAVVLPLNAVTALLGAPIVAWVLLRRGGGEAFES